jgi:hypothetical protein
MLGITELALILCTFMLGVDVAAKSYSWAVAMAVCVIVNAYLLGWFTH